jgi:dTMP kinase
MEKGTFYVVEGLDGCGKGTQIELLKQHLEQNGRAVLVVAEPGQTVIGTEIRRILKSTEYPRTPITELLLFAASRREALTEVAIPALDAGWDVIYDRFVWSTRAYQGAGLGIPDEVAQVEELVWSGLDDYRPDVVIYLDCSVETALERRRNATGMDMIERRGSEFFKRVCNEFRAMFTSEAMGLDQTAAACVVVNAEAPIEDVQKELLSKLAELEVRCG